jgi:LacI family transcriptional regulator
MATIRDVAKRAGVAPITVSRVLNNTGYISEDTRARVEAAIRELHYIPNTLSRSLRFKKTNTIALFVSDITNPFWTTITRGVEDAGSEEGYSVILCNTDENQHKLESYVNLLLQRQADGFLIVPISSDPRVVQSIQKRDIPVVVLDRPLPDVEVDVVRSDSEGGAYELVKYLIGLGHRRIVMFSGPLEIATSSQRFAGYQRALVEHGMSPDPNLLMLGEFKQESGYRMAQHMLASVVPRPTAVFAGNNLIAVGILRALYEAGLRVPDDISVVTFDDLPLVPQPFLTLAAQAPYELGRRAAKLLIAQIMGREAPGNRQIVLPVELVVRQSCMRITPANAP